MSLAEILHWLTDQAGKLAGQVEKNAVHTAIDDLLGDHTAAPQQAPAASPVQAATPEAAAVPGTDAESPADAVPPSADAPYPGPPSPAPEG